MWYRVREDTDVIERRLTLRNTGHEPVTLLRCDSASWTLPPREDYRVSHVAGDWGEEFQLARFAVPRGETVFTSRRGITSAQANPWLMIDEGGATEEHGEVWSAALAWSGSWRITLRRTLSGPVSVTGGFGQDGLSWELAPGEEWQTPVFAGLYSTGGFGATSRAWHDYAVNHVLPHPEELRPIVYNSWEATGFEVTAAGQRRLAGLAAELGAELFVVDDGWFGARDSDRAGLGDWNVNLRKFPNGLEELIDEVHRLGMRFGIWVEPEMVNPDSDLYRAHPDWIIHMPGRTRTLRRDQHVLDFSRPDVAAWAHEWLDRLVRDYAIDYLKWDMNRPFTEAAAPVYAGHVTAVYTLLDRLRADHPHLRVQDCCSGGGRADLGMLARTDEVWTSDNTDAHDRIGIQDGYSRLYPARTMGAWVTDELNPITRRRIPLRFRFHVAMAGVLGLGGDLIAWSAEDLAEAARLVADYKRIRPVVQHGALHRLRGGVQYTLGDEVVVLAFRPQVRRFGDPSPRIRLAGLDPDASYRSTLQEYGGAVLTSHGLPLEPIHGEYASWLVHLVRAP
ncbi:alpha-galactosidase [Nonomuraea endophytica]|uniref:alpha-galactosidase n=1 Tax=Nonomuraea endophytica TaxID=714136 RepID=UPI0037C96110